MGRDDAAARAWLEEAMQAHADDLVRLAYLIVRDLHAAQDIAQDAFAAGYVNFHHLQNQGAWRSWLFSIARNRALDHLRKASSRLERLVEPWRTSPQDAEPTHPSAESQALEHALSGTVWGEVMALPPAYREVLWLRYKVDWAVSDMAQTLGLLESTVKTRLLRARHALARRLQEVKLDAGT